MAGQIIQRGERICRNLLGAEMSAELKAEPDARSPAGVAAVLAAAALPFPTLPEEKAANMVGGGVWESNPTDRDSRPGPTDLKSAQVTRPDAPPLFFI